MAAKFIAGKAVGAPRRFVCDVGGCGKAFDAPKDLKRHIQGVHEGARPFQCTIEGRGKAFTTSNHLKSHVRGVHEGARPFRCTVEGCGKAFSENSDLKRHVRSVHEGVRPFECSVEGCRKTFTTSGDLKRHVRSVHEGARPFKCTVERCGKAFGANHELKRHVRGIHDGARPFPCAIEGCGRAFLEKSDLKRHVRTVHGGQGPPLTGNVGTDRAEFQSSNPPVVVKIEADQDQIGDAISAPALEVSLNQRIKNEHEFQHDSQQDVARLHIFRRLASQDRMGARVACQFELEDGTLQHFHGIVNGSDPAKPGKVDILFDDGHQWNGWPVEDVLLVVSLAPRQEALFRAESDSGSFGPYSRERPKRRLTPVPGSIKALGHSLGNLFLPVRVSRGSGGDQSWIIMKIHSTTFLPLLLRQIPLFLVLLPGQNQAWAVVVARDPDEDTYVQAFNATNYGLDGCLRVGGPSSGPLPEASVGTFFTYMQWDLGAYGIPAGSTIDSARLTMAYNNPVEAFDTVVNTRVHLVSNNSWTETKLNGMTALTSFPPSTLLATISGGFTHLGPSFEFFPISVIENSLAGDSIFSVRMESDDDVQNCWISKEIFPPQVPRLRLEFTAPTTGATALSTGAILPFSTGSAAVSTTANSATTTGATALSTGATLPFSTGSAAFSTTANPPPNNQVSGGKSGDGEQSDGQSDAAVVVIIVLIVGLVILGLFAAAAVLWMGRRQQHVSQSATGSELEEKSPSAVDAEGSGSEDASSPIYNELNVDEASPVYNTLPTDRESPVYNTLPTDSESPVYNTLPTDSESPVYNTLPTDKKLPAK